MNCCLGEWQNFKRTEQNDEARVKNMTFCLRQINLVYIASLYEN